MSLLPLTPSGGAYLSWLSEARAALELGSANFIEKDSDNVNMAMGRDARAAGD
jgi:hypothetical protein